MQRPETVNILTRIKQHYQEFIVDDYKVDEWHKELSKYDYEDVNNELDKHLRSEQNGKYLPKVYFLTRYIRTTEEKNQSEEYFVRCHQCNKVISLNDYDRHIEKCNSIEYLILACKKYFGKIITREQLLSLSNEEFYKKYWSIIEKIDDSQMDIRERSAWKNAVMTRHGYEPEFELGGI